MLTYNKLRSDITVNLSNIKVRTYTIAFFSLLFVVVLVVFAIEPVLGKISSELGQYNTLSVENAKVQTNINNLAQAENQYNTSVRSNIAILNTALPTTQQTGPLFANLNAIASSHNVQIDTVKFLTSDLDLQNLLTQSSFSIYPAPKSTLLYVTLSGKASFSDFTDFVGNLENYPRTFNLVDTNISNDSTSASTAANSRFSLTGYVYYLTNKS